jgi:hypothetical protein
VQRLRVDDRDRVRVCVRGEDAVGPGVEHDVDRLRSHLDPIEHGVRVQVDDGDEVAARAGDIRPVAARVDRDPLGVEADLYLGELPGKQARVEPARSPVQVLVQSHARRCIRRPHRETVCVFGGGGSRNRALLPGARAERPGR